MSEASTLEDEEIEILVEDLIVLYGYDFSEYAKASLKRRINRLYILDKFPSFAEFRYRLRSDVFYLQRFVEEITVNVTEMFRDPSFYKTLREDVLPQLGTYPLIRIWHAGCSTGEEVFSMAILLKEMNLYHKSLLYATDINPSVLKEASKGIFPLMHLKQYSENYILSGGKDDFSKYYTANYDRAIFSESLSEKMIFANHNLVSDHSFNEFQLIICRNVMIYFGKSLQAKVFKLFDESLENHGFIGLGSKETIRFSAIYPKFRQISEHEKIWRKIA